MEYVLNLASYTSDTSGQPDRRMRPQSAYAHGQSYYQQKDDDLGRPVLQHKPLAKGEFTQSSLAKVFEDDPGMRPKVFAPPSVNKVSYGLMSQDIAGATPQYKVAPYKARGTDPNAPRYVLPGNSAIPIDASISVSFSAAAAAAAAAADGAPDPPSHPPQRPQQQQQQQQQPQQPQFYQPPPPPWQPTLQQQQQQQPRLSTLTRDTLNVSDINTVTSVSERPARMETRSSKLDTRDVEGSWPGWEPPFRAHVGRNLRDPGLDVSDISNTFRRRRVLSARPSLGNSRGGGGSSGSASAAVMRDQTLMARPPMPTAQPPVTAATQSPDQRPQPPRAEYMPDDRKLRQSHSYLPPPLSWQPVQQATDSGPPYKSGEGASSGSGGSGGAARRHSHPVRQQPPSQPPSQPLELQHEQQQQQQSGVYAAGEWPTSVTLPLRPTLSPPPFATHIPTGSVASVLSASLDAAAVSRTAAVADHPSATVGKATPCKRDPKARHAAKLTLAEVQRADAAEAQRVISSLRPSREAVEEFFSSCRRLDRETCGKVTPTDFMHALERANLLTSPAAAGVTEPAAAAVTLARGLQDGTGMVSYRYLARALLKQTVTRRQSLTATATAATTPAASAALAASVPPAAPQPAAAAGSLVAEATGSPLTPFAAVLPTAAHSAPRPPVLSRQTSDVQGGSARPSPSAAMEGADGGACGSADGSSSGFSAASMAAAAAAAAQRRSVNWAPEPPPVDGGAADGSQLASEVRAAAQPPTTTYHPHDHKRQERQERQLRREESPRRRPYSAFPGGPKGPGAVAAVFKLLGAPQPILYDTPAPVPAPVPASTPAHAHASTCTQSLAGYSTVANPAAPAAGAPSRTQQETAVAATRAAAAAAAAPGAYDGMGFGPQWPPEPYPNNLQKRSASSIMEGTSVQLRDVCDVTYFPYKGQSMWFSGRAPPPPGPDGGEVPGGAAEAAREYQPSADITSFIVGKGHHRIHIPPNGHKLEPEVEAAIVAKLRPHSALGGSPESTARSRAAAAVVGQFNSDNPLPHPGSVDPNTPAGAALKGMLGSLYSTAGSGGGAATANGRGTASAGAAVRPATAGARRSVHMRASSVSQSMSAFASGGPGGGGAAAGGGGGGVRVGRAALERQMHRDEIAAVRRLH